MTLPNATLEGEAEICAPVTPDPDSATCAVDVPVLTFFHQFCVTSETVPVSVAAAGGENVTLNDTLCPTGIEIGYFMPLMAYPVPVTLA